MNTRTHVLAMLLVLTITIALYSMPLPQAPDPLQPGAVPFCHVYDPAEKEPVANCTCATANDGDFCKTDEPYPKFCKKMCGHAKDCKCCGLHK